MLACADYSELAEDARTYLGLERPDPKPDSAVVAVASPVVGVRVSMTNRDWPFSIMELQATLEPRRLRVVNDFSFQASAVPRLGASQFHQVGGGTAIARSGSSVLTRATAFQASSRNPVAARSSSPPSVDTRRSPRPTSER